MSCIRRGWGSAVLGSIFTLCFCATARAQAQPPADTAQLQTPGTNAIASGSTNPASPTTDKWQFVSLSYLWFPGIHGSIGARGYEASAHVSPSDLISHFNFGIMGSFEAQYNRWGFPVDYVWAKLGDNKTLTNFPGYTANPTVKEGFLTPKVTYLLVDGERIKIRATAGIRYWHAGANLKLTPPGSPSVSVGSSVNWVDFVGGANIMAPLSPKIAFMMLGDAGGGGANVDYQVAGMLNYQIKPKWGIGLGYRYVDINYRNSNQIVLDATQSGIALTLLYKYGKQPPVQ
jgi:opacity protein-like surface antigen